MRAFKKATADCYEIGDVEVVRWEQYGLADHMPFGAMWYVVPPGASTPVHSHPEPELSIVISGSAIVNGAVEVGQADAFLAGPDEDHTLRNTSADQPLVVFSAYWMPDEDAAIAFAGEAAHV